MRRVLSAAMRAASALAPPAADAGAAARPISRVPPAVALAAARALSGASAGGRAPAAPPSAPPDAGAAAESGGDGDGATVAAAPAQRKELYMVFTCRRCDTRAVKGFSRQAYEHGVVLVDCPGCKARHLVADRKGWFGEPGSVENFLAERGEAVQRRGGAGEDALEISAEELAGWTPRAAPPDTPRS